MRIRAPVLLDPAARGSVPWRFRTGYDVERQVDGWRIVVCVAYEEAPLA